MSTDQPSGPAATSPTAPPPAVGQAPGGPATAPGGGSFTPGGGSFSPQGPGAYATGQPYYGAPQPPAPPEKRKSWFARHKILTALLVVLGLVVVSNIATGEEGAPADAAPAGAVEEPPADGGEGAGDPPPAGGTDGEADTEAPAEGEAPAQEDEASADEPPATQPGIGTAVRDGKFEFTVNGVEAGVTEVGDEYFGEQAQGQFVLVDLTVTNIGQEAQTLFGDNQTLVDGQGREHSANTMAGIYLDDNDTFVNEINPGNTVQGTVVFDIPADAVPASLELHDSAFSGGVTVSLTD